MADPTSSAILRPEDSTSYVISSEKMPPALLSWTAEKLIGVVSDLSGVFDIPAIMAVVREAARELTGADGVCFVLREADFCHYADESAIGPLWKGKRFPIETCISGWVMVNREQVVIHDVFQDARIPHDAYRATFVKSLGMVPIRRANPVGALGAYWAKPHYASRDEMQILNTLADAASVSIANANMYEQLKAQNERKDEFLFMLAHELRNPLAPLKAAAKILETKADDLNTVTRLREIIDRQVKQLSALVDGLLESSRIIKGKLEINLERTDLNDFMTQMSADFQEVFLEGDLKFKVSIPAETIYAAADSTRLRQVICNLLDNALKHSGSGTEVELTLSGNGDTALIVCRDNGSGIETKLLPYIFESLAQGDRSLDRTKGGLGLGLSVVKGLVEAQGGKVSAVSNGAGCGTEFVIALPRLP